MNPYWLACTTDLGRRPTNLEFILWMSRRWSAYRASRRISANATISEHQREEFGAALAREVSL